MANDGFAPTRPDGTNHGVSRNTPTTPANVEAVVDKMRRAASFRAAGLTFREIGERLGCDPTWARTLVLKALEEAKYESAELMRTQIGLRLDALLATYTGRALQGELEAAKFVRSVIADQRQLFGTDAPIRVDVADVTDDAVLVLAEELGVSVLPAVQEQ